MAGNETSIGEKVMEILREENKNKRSSLINNLINELWAERYAEKYIRQFSKGKNQLTANRAKLLGTSDNAGDIETESYTVIYINLMHFGSDSVTVSHECFYSEIVPEETGNDNAGELHPGEKYLHDLIQRFYNKTAHEEKKITKNETTPYNDDIKAVTPPTAGDTVLKPKHKAADPLSIKEKNRKKRAHEYFELYLKSRGLDKPEARKQFMQIYKKDKSD